MFCSPRSRWLFLILIIPTATVAGRQTHAPTASSEIFGDFNVDRPRPKFEDYPVSKIYTGKPAAPVITKESRAFRTMISRGARSDVQFAGHYTLPGWGCGTGCSGFVIVDSFSGKIYEIPFAVDELPFDWIDAHEDDANRIEFHPNSRLLKVNACPNEDNCGLYDFVMVEGKGLRLIRRQLLPAEFQLASPLLQSFLQNYVGMLGERRTTRYFAVTVSLSGSAELQEIVYLTGDGWCGSSGCTLLVLDEKGYSDDYTVVSKIVGVRPPVRVLSSKTSGWYDLSVRVQGGGIVNAHEAKLRFNGGSYAISVTASQAQALTARVAGEVAVPTSITLQPLFQ